MSKRLWTHRIDKTLKRATTESCVQYNLEVIKSKFIVNIVQKLQNVDLKQTLSAQKLLCKLSSRGANMNSFKTPPILWKQTCQVLCEYQCNCRTVHVVNGGNSQPACGQPILVRNRTGLRFWSSNFHKSRETTEGGACRSTFSVKKVVLHYCEMYFFDVNTSGRVTCSAFSGTSPDDCAPLVKSSSIEVASTGVLKTQEMYIKYNNLKNQKL